MHLARLLLPLFATSALSAQIAPDEWVLSTFTDYLTSQTVGKLWLVDAAMTTATPLGNQTADMAAANCVAVDDRGFVFYGTLNSARVPVPNPSSILALVIAGGSVAVETPLTSGPIDSGSISGIALRGDQIWFVSDSGNVGWIPKAGGTPTIVMNINTAGVLGLGQSIATNGREIFIGSSYGPTTPDPANVWYFDAEAATPTLMPLGFLNGSAFAMSLGRDNQALVGRINGQLWYADHIAGSVTQINVGAPAPQSNCNGTAINPWTNVVANVPGYGSTARVAGFYDVVTNAWPVTLNLDLAIPSGAAASCEQPFFLFGHGCAAPNNVEPRQTWTGMPLQGQNFTLSLRDAEMGVALLLLGFSDTTGPLGPLPTDLGLLGAPGCNLYTSSDAVLPHPVTTSTASQLFTLPTIPSLAGLQLHAQWLILGSALTTTEAVHIRVR